LRKVKALKFDDQIVIIPVDFLICSTLNFAFIFLKNNLNAISGICKNRKLLKHDRGCKN